MIIAPLGIEHVEPVSALMKTGEPYIRVRSSSDYWAYAHLFSSTCPVAVLGDVLVGAVIAFRSQDAPAEIYVQDVVVHPDHRGGRLVGRLLEYVTRFGSERGCSSVYLTSEPENTSAHRAWLGHGFVNRPGDRLVGEVSVTSDFKGPGKDRAVYDLRL